MEHVCSSKEDECLLIYPNKEIKGHGIVNSTHEEEPPLLLDFPSPFFDKISTTPLLINSHTSFPKKPSNNITDHPSSESNRPKKRSVGKKDRHSKIHTAQGLRDRRMRLSLHIARKFFHLQDLLGFDKASKTIEWLFCKSKNAIKEVAENFNPQHHTNESLSEEMESWMHSLMSECSQIKASTNKLENSKEEIKNRDSRKRNQNISLARDQARARARDRTRERLMIKELEKQLFGGNNNPKDEIYKLGIGYTASPNNNNNHNVEELLGYTSQSIQLQASTPTLTTHHFLRELQLTNINVNGFENNSGSIVGASTLINHNTPAGYQNSSDGFYGIPGEWDADTFLTESCNYGMVL